MAPDMLKPVCVCPSVRPCLCVVLRACLPQAWYLILFHDCVHGYGNSVPSDTVLQLQTWVLQGSERLLRHCLFKSLLQQETIAIWTKQCLGYFPSGALELKSSWLLLALYSRGFLVPSDWTSYSQLKGLVSLLVDFMLISGKAVGFFFLPF